MKFGRNVIIFLSVLVSPFLSAQETFFDDFDPDSYSEAVSPDGSQSWSSDWIENNDDSAGTPSAGRIRIIGNRLRFTRLNTNRSIQRSLNLTGYDSAILTLDFEVENLQPSDRFSIEISSDGGSTFTEVDWISGSYSDSYTEDITPFITSNTVIRFNNLGANWSTDTPVRRIFLDNVLVTVTSIGPLDTDNDGVTDDIDNCVVAANTNQLDSDGDGVGDACDEDDDNDGILDDDEGCLNNAVAVTAQSGVGNPSALLQKADGILAKFIPTEMLLP